MNNLKIMETLNGYIIKLDCGRFFLSTEDKVIQFLLWYRLEDKDIQLTTATILSVIDDIKK